MTVSRPYRPSPTLLTLAEPVRQVKLLREPLERLLSWSGRTPLPGTVVRPLTAIGTCLLYQPLPGEKVCAKADLFQQRLPELAALLQKLLPPFRRKATRYLEEFWWSWPLARLRQTPHLHRLVERVAGPPLETHRDASGVFRVFLELQAESHRERFLEAPVPCLQHFEKLAHREDRHRLMAQGLTALARRLPETMVDWFLAHPHPLGRTAEQLGGLDPARADALLRHELSQTLFQLRPTDPLEAGKELARLGSHLIPQPVADYLDAGKQPDPQTVGRLLDTLTRSLAIRRIEHLRVAVRDCLRGRIELDAGQTEQTLEWAETERRLRRERKLRRYLRARLAGDLAPEGQIDPLMRLLH